MVGQPFQTQCAETAAETDAKVEKLLSSILSTKFHSTEIGADGVRHPIWMIQIEEGGDWQWMLRSEAKEWYFPSEVKEIVAKLL